MARSLVSNYMRALARRMHRSGPERSPSRCYAVNASYRDLVLTPLTPGLDHRAAARAQLSITPFDQRPSDPNEHSTEARIIGVVQRLLAERSIDRPVRVSDELREVGLSSLDMVSLVLSVEAEFDLMVPEDNIMPINFRSVAAISRLVDSLRTNQ
jgi:acyl carrier protein